MTNKMLFPWLNEFASYTLLQWVLHGGRLWIHLSDEVVTCDEPAKLQWTWWIQNKQPGWNSLHDHTGVQTSGCSLGQPVGPCIIPQLWSIGINLLLNHKNPLATNNVPIGWWLRSTSSQTSFECSDFISISMAFLHLTEQYAEEGSCSATDQQGNKVVQCYQEKG